MPLVANSTLPTFERLRLEGENVVTRDAALHQDIRELHIGLLNMMPDAALAATERQFFRLVGESNAIAQFYVHPFTLAELARGAEAQSYVAQYYESFEQIKEQGLDALIMIGGDGSMRALLIVAHELVQRRIVRQHFLASRDPHRGDHGTGPRAAQRRQEGRGKERFPEPVGHDDQEALVRHSAYTCSTCVTTREKS